MLTNTSGQEENVVRLLASFIIYPKQCRTKQGNKAQSTKLKKGGGQKRVPESPILVSYILIPTYAIRIIRFVFTYRIQAPLLRVFNARLECLFF